MSQDPVASPIEAPASRSALCPCGSGQRYKNCHGASSAASTPIALYKPKLDDIKNRAMLQQQSGQLTAAIALHQEALQSEPDDAVTQHFLGLALANLGRYDEGFEWLDKAIEAMPEEPEFHNNMATIHLQLGEYQQALDAADLALQLSPAHALAHCNKALALQEIGQHSDAIPLFERALKLEPRLVQAQWNESLSLLALGRYPLAFALYEKRYLLPGYLAGVAFPNTPRWDGVPIPGKRLLVIAEQGLGDSLQFMRFVSYYADLAMNVTLAVPQTLLALARRLDPRLSIVSDTSILPPHDAWTGLMSLPYHRKLTAANIGSKAPYLKADPELVAQLQAQTPSKHRRIGLCFSGNTQRPNHERRVSLPPSFLQALAQLPNITWVSLQKGEREDEFKQYFPAGIEVALESMDDTAALASTCEHIISIDTSVAHLAGGLGLPTTVLLSTPAEWRWCLAEETTPWYPNTRLLRQAQTGDWSTVLTQLQAQLAP